MNKISAVTIWHPPGRKELNKRKHYLILAFYVFSLLSVLTLAKHPPLTFAQTSEYIFNSGFENNLDNWSGNNKQWWLAGDIPASSVIAAYQPKGSESYSQSKINLQNPGIHDLAEGTVPACTEINVCTGATAPSWNQASGWSFDGISNYLGTDIIPAADKTGVIIQFANGQVAGINHLAGSTLVTDMENHEVMWELLNFQYSYAQGILYGFEWPNVPKSGISAASGEKYYFDGKLIGQLEGSWGDNESPSSLFIGAFHHINASTLEPRDVAIIKGSFDISAIAFYNEELTNTQVAAVSDAMSTISGNVVTINTNIAYEGIASAEISAASNFPFVRTVELDKNGNYQLIAYVFNQSNIPTSEDVSLIADGTVLTPDFSDAGNGWYQLSSTVTENAGSHQFGVLVKAGKRLNIDNVSVVYEIPIASILAPSVENIPIATTSALPLSAAIVQDLIRDSTDQNPKPLPSGDQTIVSATPNKIQPTPKVIDPKQINPVKPNLPITPSYPVPSALPASSPSPAPSFSPTLRTISSIISQPKQKIQKIFQWFTHLFDL